MSWSEDNVAALRRMWNEEGLTAGQISLRLGFSRNGVLSKVRRLGLDGRPNQRPAMGGRSGLSQFERMIDLIVDAPLNHPVTVMEAARDVGMPSMRAIALWTDLCRKYGEFYSAGSDYRMKAR